MAQFAAVNPERHGNKYWRAVGSYDFASKSHLVPVVGAELSRVALSMPLAFVFQENRYIMVCVLSLVPGRNLYVGPQGQWLSSHVPSWFRGLPFRLGKTEGRREHVLCVDEGSGLVSDGDGEPFFDENGELASSVRDIMDLLTRMEHEHALTKEAVDTLADAGLITEWHLHFKAAENVMPVKGLYRIDEAALNSLDDETFLKLRRAQSLPVAYAQLLSMANIIHLEELIRKREEFQQAQSDMVPDMAGLFGDKDADSALFKF